MSAKAVVLRKQAEELLKRAKEEERKAKGQKIERAGRWVVKNYEKKLKGILPENLRLELEEVMFGAQEGVAKKKREEVAA